MKFDFYSTLSWKLKAAFQDISLAIEKAWKLIPLELKNKYDYLEELGYDVNNMSVIEVDETYDKERWKENFR